MVFKLKQSCTHDEYIRSLRINPKNGNHIEVFTGKSTRTYLKGQYYGTGHQLSLQIIEASILSLAMSKIKYKTDIDCNTV